MTASLQDMVCFQWQLFSKYSTSRVGGTACILVAWGTSQHVFSMEQFAGNHEVSSVQRIPDFTVFDFFGFINLLSWENLSCSSRFRMNYETICHTACLHMVPTWSISKKTAHSNCFIVFIPNDVHRYQRDPGQEQDIKHMEELADTKRWELHLGWAFFQCEGSKKINLDVTALPKNKISAVTTCTTHMQQLCGPIFFRWCASNWLDDPHCYRWYWNHQAD